MPLSESFMKDMRFAGGNLFSWLTNGFKLPVIVVWPDFPSKKTTIYKITNRLNYRLTNKLVQKPAVVIYFDDSTFGSSDELVNKYPGLVVLNADCTDISKKKVDDVHQRVFGYNTFIHPINYHGKAVQKSDINALHDGRVIDCPCDQMDVNSVYQVLINNEVDEELVMDYRVPVINGRLIHVYKKFKRNEVRFTNEVSYSELHVGHNLFSKDEEDLIKNFTIQMGANFCELDILRNQDDGKIYIIDVNKTPYGPPSGLSDAHRKEAIDRLVAGFLEILK